ncbi:hypothetical protein [Nocardia sienata]|uniref:hypothetical protein n=1 Tax=Nocardia sienata TaxID=248552 RepID=UPI0007A56078|nr:hypothetical protein [Nocardia sienata]
MALLVLTASVLLTQSNLPAAGDGRDQKGLAQLTDHPPTPPEPLDDDYDVELEEPVIDDDEPSTWQDFAEDARTGGSGEPVVGGPGFGFELPGPARSVIEGPGPR